MTEKKGLILIVEDDRHIRSFLAEFFHEEGFPVATAENGRIALESFQGPETIPALIFLDLMMPEMDGQTFLKELQKSDQDKRLKKIPVVVLSAVKMEIKGKVAAYLEKPPLLEDLYELAEKYAGNSPATEKLNPFILDPT